MCPSRNSNFQSDCSKICFRKTSKYLNIFIKKSIFEFQSTFTTLVAMALHIFLPFLTLSLCPASDVFTGFQYSPLFYNNENFWILKILWGWKLAINSINGNGSVWCVYVLAFLDSRLKIEITVKWCSSLIITNVVLVLLKARLKSRGCGTWALWKNVLRQSYKWRKGEKERMPLLEHSIRKTWLFTRDQTPTSGTTGKFVTITAVEEAKWFVLSFVMVIRQFSME